MADNPKATDSNRDIRVKALLAGVALTATFVVLAVDNPTLRIAYLFILIILLVCLSASYSNGLSRYVVGALVLGLLFAAFVVILRIHTEPTPVVLDVSRRSSTAVGDGTANARAADTRGKNLPATPKSKSRAVPTASETLSDVVDHTRGLPGSADGSYVIHTTTERVLTIVPRTKIVRDGRSVPPLTRPNAGDVITFACVRSNELDCHVNTLWLPSLAGYDYPEAAWDGKAQATPGQDYAAAVGISGKEAGGYQELVTLNGRVSTIYADKDDVWHLLLALQDRSDVTHVALSPNAEVWLDGSRQQISQIPLDVYVTATGFRDLHGYLTAHVVRVTTVSKQPK